MRARLFGAEAALYDRVRPAYPRELVDDVVALVGRPSRAVDVGAGTGKATVMLAERGVLGVAVEPDPQMARVAERNLAAFGGWRVEPGEFERWRPRRGESEFDLITAAHSWHWIRGEEGVRQAEGLLHPRGWLAIWRHEHVSRGTALEQAIGAAYALHAPQLAGGHAPPWRTVPPESGFGRVVERSYPWCGEYSAEQWTSLMRTFSDHIVMSRNRFSLLASAVAKAIEAHGGTYRRCYVCRLWAGERSGKGI